MKNYLLASIVAFLFVAGVVANTASAASLNLSNQASANPLLISVTTPFKASFTLPKSICALGEEPVVVEDAVDELLENLKLKRRDVTIVTNISERILGGTSYLVLCYSINSR